MRKESDYDEQGPVKVVCLPKDMIEAGQKITEEQFQKQRRKREKELRRRKWMPWWKKWYYDWKYPVENIY